jgi:hypothetical protein
MDPLNTRPGGTHPTPRATPDGLPASRRQARAFGLPGEPYAVGLMPTAIRSRRFRT